MSSRTISKSYTNDDYAQQSSEENEKETAKLPTLPTGPCTQTPVETRVHSSNSDDEGIRNIGYTLGDPPKQIEVLILLYVVLLMPFAGVIARTF